MADSGLLKVGIFAGVGYLAWKYISGMTPATATTTGTQGSTTTGGSTPGVAFNSLDAIYQRLAAAVGSTPYTADQFNFYLAGQLPAGKTPPSPTDVFTAAGWDRSVPMTLANYWGAMAPYLKSNLGLSGLGCYGELYGAMRGGLYGIRRRG